MPTSVVTLSLNSALQWGKVTDRQVREAIGDPAELHANTRQELKALLATRGDSFEPAARVALETALATPEKTFDPPLARFSAFMRNDNAGVEYTRVPGQLVVGDLSPHDVVQGGLGDCYFLATLSGFAATRPDVLKDAITDNHNGTYTVRFFQDDPAYGLQATYVTVDDDFPTRNGWPVYAQTPGGELWPAVMEKAYAKFKGSYGLIGNGGMPGQVAFDLTGDVSSLRLVALTSERGTFDRVSRALEKSQAVMAATLPDQLRGADRKVTGIVGGHVYSVARAFEENGEQFIEVRNPWGSQGDVMTPRGLIPAQNGSVVLTAAEFKDAFPAAFIAD